MNSASKATFNVHQAKTHLSKLLRRVARGEEVVIARAGKPVAKLVPFEEPPETGKIPLGGCEGMITSIDPNFDDEDPEIISMFEDGELEPPPR